MILSASFLTRRAPQRTVSFQASSATNLEVLLFVCKPLTPWNVPCISSGSMKTRVHLAKEESRITCVILSVSSFFLFFAYYNRIRQKSTQYMYKIHTSTSLWLFILSNLLVCSPETPEEECCYQRGHLQIPQRAFYFAPATKRRTTFPSGRVWVLKCSLMDGFIHQARSVHSSTTKLPWGTVSDSDHSASLWNHINI